MAKRSPKQEEPDMDDKMRQAFRDILAGPAARKRGFATLKSLEEGTNVVYLPGAPATPKKRTRSKAAPEVPTEEKVETVLRMFRKYQVEIRAILSIGGQAATTLLGILFHKKPQLPPPAAD